jgi:hypothetical protein
MGKLLKRILIPVGIVVVLVGGAYFLLSSGNTVPATDGTLTINSDEIQKRLIHGMADTKKNGQISLSLTEEDLNKALNGVLAALPSDAKGKIKGAHVDITDSSYDFAVDIEVPMFKTEIVLVTDLVDNINTDDPLQGSYEFDIKEAKVGRLGHLETIAFSILGGFLNNDSISSSFASSGIHVTPDLSGRKILYTKANLLADLKTMLSSGDSDSSLAVGFLNQTVESNLLKASFHETDSLKVVADLTSMKTNADYCEEGKASTLDIPAFRDKVASLMNAGIFDISKSNAATMMNYLLKGYASLSDSEKTFISPLDLSSVGITNNETYKGARPSESETVKKALGEGFLSVASEIAAHPSQDKINLFRLGEDTISGTLLESNVFGTSSVLYTKEEDNTYTLATTIPYECLYGDPVGEDGRQSGAFRQRLSHNLGPGHEGKRPGQPESHLPGPGYLRRKYPSQGGAEEFRLRASCFFSRRFQWNEFRQGQRGVIHRYDFLLLRHPRSFHGCQSRSLPPILERRQASG